MGGALFVAWGQGVHVYRSVYVCVLGVKPLSDCDKSE